MWGKKICRSIDVNIEINIFHDFEEKYFTVFQQIIHTELETNRLCWWKQLIILHI